MVNRPTQLLKLYRGQRTILFTSPTSRPSSISRASSLCPTSSNASVASCPPTSRRTSSPPLASKHQPRVPTTSSVMQKQCRSTQGNFADSCALIGAQGYTTTTVAGEDVRMLVNEGRGIVYFVMDDNKEVLDKGRPMLASACSLRTCQGWGRPYLLPTVCLHIFKGEFL